MSGRHDGHSHAGRDCIAPEVNRNKNIGEKGSNMDHLMYERFLATMGFNTKRVRTCPSALNLYLEPVYPAANIFELTIADQ